LGARLARVLFAGGVAGCTNAGVAEAFAACSDFIGAV
jgi:hypothetical protein